MKRLKLGMLMMGLLALGSSAYAQGGFEYVDFGGLMDKAYAGVVVEDPLTGAVERVVAVGFADDENFAAAAGLRPDGSLDTDFGTNGLVRIPNSSSESDNAEAAALQSDGKIVIGGRRYSSSSRSTAWLLARINDNGSLDTSFGNQGIVTRSVLSKASDQHIQHVVVDDSTGNIVAAGHCRPNMYVGAVMRVKQNGSLDKTFGKGGVVIPKTLFRSWWIEGAAFQQVSDETKILLSGYANLVPDSRNYVVLMRLNANGSLDTTFGGGLGYVLSGDYFRNKGLKVAAHPNGAIFVAAAVEDSSQGYYGLFRYTADGVEDGRVITNGLGEPGSIAIQLDPARPDYGTILLGGSDGFTTTLARYNPDLTLDETFGDPLTPGMVVGPPGAGITNDIQLASDGSIYCFGEAWYNLPSVDFLVGHFWDDGSIDETF